MRSKISSDFIEAVKTGLTKRNKSIPSSYLYDNKGSEIFVQITKLSEYYLTNCELEIFQNKSGEILDAIDIDIEEVVELGCGDGHKTEILVSKILEDHDCKFIPVDISEDAIKQITETMSTSFPNLEVQGYHGDYFHYLNDSLENTKRGRLFLFLGSNIGNFSSASAVNFLSKIRSQLTDRDFLLLGADLKKEIGIMNKAYNDTSGITSEFNYNLLERINRELGADFSRSNFYHHGIYNPQIGAMQSFLISKKEQKVEIPLLDEVVGFDKLEPIHIENSHKYSYKDLAELAENSGFQLIENFTDSNEYFVDSLWKKK